MTQIPHRLVVASVEILGKMKKMAILNVDRKDFSVFEIGYVCPE